MITFTSLLWIWKGEAAGRWFFLTVPDEQCDPIRAAGFETRRGFGSVRVEAAIPSTSSGQAADVRWRTSVFPLNTGGYILPVKADIRKRAKLAAGASVTVELTPID